MSGERLNRCSPYAAVIIARTETWNNALAGAGVVSNGRVPSTEFGPSCDRLMFTHLEDLAALAET